MKFVISVLVTVFASLMCSVPVQAETPTNDFQYADGGIIRGSRDKKQIALEFTADTFSSGAKTILDELEKHHVKGSFFLTGNFLRNQKNLPLLQQIKASGHYLGPHSNSHPLYCPWSGEKKTLVTKEFFAADLKTNLDLIEKSGFDRAAVKFWIPPYEHYNAEIAQWSRELGLTLINYTSGTRSNADYIEDDAKNFVSSKAILDSIMAREKKEGLNGYLLLLHFGVSPKRTDKMANQLGVLLDYLQKQGYTFVRVDELLSP